MNTTVQYFEQFERLTKKIILYEINKYIYIYIKNLLKTTDIHKISTLVFIFILL